MVRPTRHRNGKGTSSTPSNAAGQSGRPAALPPRDNAFQFARELQRTRTGSIRYILLAIVCGHYLQKSTKKILLPFGPAKSHPPLELGKVDMQNDLLQLHHNKTQKIFAAKGAPLHGPETVVFGNDGSMYILSEDANLVKIHDLQPVAEDGVTIQASATIVADLGMGRPLGGRFTPKGNTLYIGDSVLGLTRIQNIKDRKSKLEIVARTVVDRHGISTPILYADDVTIGPKTGKVYFTDATDLAPRRQYSFEPWGTLPASKLDLARGKAMGRILQYDPHTDTTTILAQNLRFANGIAVDKDETYLIVAETFGINLWKYHLSNGTMEVLVASRDLPGYVDGVDCSWTTGLCYAVMPSATVPAHFFWNSLPMKGSQLLRTVLLMLPPWMAPAVSPFGGLLEVDPISKAFRFILDPTGKDVRMLTGVTVYKDKLYLGSLENDYIGLYNL
jgi:Strictosidine synthase